MPLLDRLALLLLLLLAPLPAAAQARDPQGLWALQADGRMLALLELRRDDQGGWRGDWSRPERFSVDGAGTASEIGGPVVRRPILATRPAGDAIELDIQGREPGGPPDRFSFRLVADDAAELRLIGAPLAPFALRRVAAGTTVAADWDPARRYALAPPFRRSNPEMAEMFAADQAARRSRPIDWAVLGPLDAARRQRTRLLLAAGALASADDFYHAAFIFQHGEAPDDYLLAHTLAIVAAARGRPDAAWIAAASLDRYLQSIGRPQIYGTQYTTRPGGAVTQEPYDRALVSDALRGALGVPPQADQERRRGELEADRH